MSDLTSLFEKTRQQSLRIGNLFEKRSGEWNCYLWRRDAGELDPPFLGVGKTAEQAISAAHEKALLRKPLGDADEPTAAAVQSLPEPPASEASPKPKKRLLAALDDIL